MSAFYSKSELQRFKKYKKHYTDQGYPADVASQYAWDFIHAARRAKGGDTVFGFRTAR